MDPISGDGPMALILQKMGDGSHCLPTEAEWEFACRAGSTTAFANWEIIRLFCDHDANLYAMGWYCGNTQRHTHRLTPKNNDSWSLYDLHGKVSEWCQDCYSEYLAAPQEDPVGPPSCPARVVRGGSWFGSAKTCHSAHRFKWPLTPATISTSLVSVS